MSNKKQKKHNKSVGGKGGVAANKLPINANDCIFCGNKGNMSKQHIWPDWMQNIIKTNHTKTVHRTQAPPSTFSEGYYQESIRDGRPGSQRIRKVCQPCNSGWINVLETTMRPIFTSLVLGIANDLTIQDQRDLATWAVLATMVYEFRDEKTIATPQKERSHLYTNKTIPEKWQVWIGKTSGLHDYSQSIYHRGLALKNPQTMISHKIINSQCSLFIVEDLVLFTVRIPCYLRDYKFEGQLADKLIQMHPRVEELINWSTLPIISEIEINSIVDIFTSFYII